MRRLVLSALVVIVLAGAVRSQPALQVKTLTDTKAATVFIRVEKDKVGASGSGFLVRTDGDTGYVVTNHHVVHLTTKVERRAPGFPGGMPRLGPPDGFPPFPIPRPPRIPLPGSPFDDEPRKEMVEVVIPSPEITVVFHSGTKQERSARGVVVGADAAADLAVLKVTGVKELPRPLIVQSPELNETMPIYLLGFPFGTDLGIARDNPAVTVSKAALSSIRTDKSGAVQVIQFDGSVNPGNSGGPVIDPEGKLVGVVVAKIRNTSIGMAIPTRQVERLLTGRVVQTQLVATTVDKSTLDVRAEVTLVDPLDKLTALSLYYAPADAVTAAARTDGLAKLAGSKRVELRRDGTKAVATFRVPLPDKPGFEITCQVTHAGADGKMVMGELTTCGPRLSNPPTATLTPSLPRVDNPPPPIFQPVVPYDAASLKAALTPSKVGDRGPLVGVSLPALTVARRLTDQELTGLLADLQDAARADQAIGNLHNVEADPKRRAEVARLLEKWATKTDWGVFGRAKAAAALRWWGTTESVAPLISVVNDTSPHAIHVRHPALWSLAYLGGDEAVATITGRMEDFIDRRSVVQMLQQMGSVAEPQALKLLQSAKAEVRHAGAQVLQVAGTKSCAAALFKVVEGDENEGVRQAARTALQAIAARQNIK